MILPIRSVIFTPVTPVAPVRGPDGSETPEHLLLADRERQKGKRRARRQDPDVRMATVSPAVFDPGNFDTTAARVELAETAGRRLGIEMRDFHTFAAFLDAMESVAARLDATSVTALSDEAGLSLLDLTLGDLVRALRHPGSGDSVRLDDALRRRAIGDDPPSDHAIHFDDAGLYTA